MRPIPALKSRGTVTRTKVRPDQARQVDTSVSVLVRRRFSAARTPTTYPATRPSTTAAAFGVPQPVL
jgi:hypothetical protein